MTSPDTIRNTVREGYGQIARAGQSPRKQEQATGCCGGGGCCGPVTLTAEQVASAVGYASDELAAIPEGANLGLSCGNPTALASLKPGETVLDLGSGAGVDCFIAGPKVGAGGRIIGVDMTADMLSRAREHLARYESRSGLRNVEFRLGEIEHLPVADNSVDVVISNCVINLSPDKEQVWREIARVLKPGGRVAISDLALLRPLPEAVRNDVEALIGCVAGASLVEDIRSMAAAAGLEQIELTSKGEYIQSLTSGQDPLYQKLAAEMPADAGVAECVTSLDISARKPG